MSYKNNLGKETTMIEFEYLTTFDKALGQAKKERVSRCFIYNASKKIIVKCVNSARSMAVAYKECDTHYANFHIDRHDLSGNEWVFTKDEGEAKRTTGLMIELENSTTCNYNKDIPITREYGFTPSYRSHQRLIRDSQQ